MRRSVTVALALVLVGSCAVAVRTDRASAGEQSGDRPRNYKPLLRIAIADIERFWEATYPTLYGGPYEPVQDVIAAHPGTPLPECLGRAQSYDDVRNNAYYCPGANNVVYDDEQLFPFLFRDFGEFAPALVIAHEWGHAIQDRAHLFDRKSVFVELQADCFAGSWLASVGRGERLLQLEGGELDSGLAALISIRDAPGSSPDDPGAHGSAFDRTGALQTGFLNGPTACAAYYDNPPFVVEIPFSSEEEAAHGGNLPPDVVIPAAVQLLNSFYRDVVPDVYRPLPRDHVIGYDLTNKQEPPTFCGATLTREGAANRVLYCAADQTIGFHRKYLRHVYDDIGDFGVVTLIADAWATHVQTLQGTPGVAEGAQGAELAADCSSGAFTGALVAGKVEVDPKTRKAAYAVSPGDLDEAVQAFLDYTSALGIDATTDQAFGRYRAFRDGFFNGFASCAALATPS
ncbi:MAG TPA: neutral zinc metallopeptidase [Acidimicrobiia bacterium]